jgi:hypothetical protein
MRPKTKTQKVNREVLDRIQLPSGANMVLIHIPHQNKDTTTKSGILVVGDQDFKPAQHAERWGYVYRIPDKLVFDGDDPYSSQWETTIECEVGDKVWFDYHSAMYAYTMECEGEWYKIMSYTSLYVVLRGDKIIPLNGYMMLKRYIPPKKSELSLDEKADEDYGIVYKAGRPNTNYLLDVWNDDVEINEGDHVLFEAGTSCFPLEHSMHQEFVEGDLVLQHRKRVLAVVSEDHSHILRLHTGVFGVKVREDKLEKGGITLTKSMSSIRIGDVVVSSHDKIKEGSVVILPKKQGTEFNGLEYYTEDRIYYYETT